MSTNRNRNERCDEKNTEETYKRQTNKWWAEEWTSYVAKKDSKIIGNGRSEGRK